MTQRKTREHLRINRAFSFRYRLPWSRTWHVARTRDISAGGMSFETSGGLWPAGLKMEVEVDFPVASFRAQVRVARTRRGQAGREVGVSFKRLDEEARENLARYSYLCVRSAS
jgi:c-di-GMP-binding flagellar brake protein YcgR